MLRQGLKTRRILSVLRDEDSGMTLRLRDIYNIKDRLHREFLGAHEPIQALLQSFLRMEIGTLCGKPIKKIGSDNKWMN